MAEFCSTVQFYKKNSENNSNPEFKVFLDFIFNPQKDILTKNKLYFVLNNEHACHVKIGNTLFKWSNIYLDHMSGYQLRYKNRLTLLYKLHSNRKIRPTHFIIMKCERDLQ